MDKEQIYSIINGELDLERIILPGGMKVENEFENGRECEKLYEKVYETNRRICARLGVEEDSDVEIIISCMSRIAKTLALKMYTHGVQAEKTGGV